MKHINQIEANVVALAQKVTAAGKPGEQGESRYLDAVRKLNHARAQANMTVPYPLKKKYR